MAGPKGSVVIACPSFYIASARHGLKLKGDRFPEKRALLPAVIEDRSNRLMMRLVEADTLAEAVNSPTPRFFIHCNPVDFEMETEGAEIIQW